MEMPLGTLHGCSSEQRRGLCHSEMPQCYSCTAPLCNCRTCGATWSVPPQYFIVIFYVNFYIIFFLLFYIVAPHWLVNVQPVRAGMPAAEPPPQPPPHGPAPCGTHRVQPTAKSATAFVLVAVITETCPPPAPRAGIQLDSQCAAHSHVSHRELIALNVVMFCQHLHIEGKAKQAWLAG